MGSGGPALEIVSIGRQRLCVLSQAAVGVSFADVGVAVAGGCRRDEVAQCSAGVACVQRDESEARLGLRGAGSHAQRRLVVGSRLAHVAALEELIGARHIPVVVAPRGHAVVASRFGPRVTVGRIGIRVGGVGWDDSDGLRGLASVGHVGGRGVWSASIEDGDDGRGGRQALRHRRHQALGRGVVAADGQDGVELCARLGRSTAGQVGAGEQQARPDQGAIGGDGGDGLVARRSDATFLGHRQERRREVEFRRGLAQHLARTIEVVLGAREVSGLAQGVGQQRLRLGAARFETQRVFRVASRVGRLPLLIVADGDGFPAQVGINTCTRQQIGSLEGERLGPRRLGARQRPQHARIPFGQRRGPRELANGLLVALEIIASQRRLSGGQETSRAILAAHAQYRGDSRPLPDASSDQAEQDHDRDPASEMASAADRQFDVVVVVDTQALRALGPWALRGRRRDLKLVAPARGLDAAWRAARARPCLSGLGRRGWRGGRGRRRGLRRRPSGSGRGGARGRGGRSGRGHRSRGRRRAGRVAGLAHAEESVLGGPRRARVEAGHTRRWWHGRLLGRRERTGRAVGLRARRRAALKGAGLDGHAGERRVSPALVWARRPTFLLDRAGRGEEGAQLGDVPEALEALPRAADLVLFVEAAFGDAPLELLQRSQLELTAVASPDAPRALCSLGARSGTEDFEEMTAVRALDRRASGGDQGLVELVLGTAALAGDVHGPRRPRAYPRRAPLSKSERLFHGPCWPFTVPVALDLGLG